MNSGGIAAVLAIAIQAVASDGATVAAALAHWQCLTAAAAAAADAVAANATTLHSHAQKTAT